MTKAFVAALVGAPFGIKGWVKIRSLSGETEHLLSLKQVVLRLGDKKSEYTVEGALGSPLALKFAGIGSPEAAKALRGAELLVPREQAAPLHPAEFYIEDLRGLEVFTPRKDEAASGQVSREPNLNTGVESAGAQNEFAGIIIDVVEGGGGFLAEILLSSGEKKLVPFRDEFFGPIDPATGRVELLIRWILE
ncbi:MAG: ribosome maturation factor RimM [Spirochaetaceae bacterium]|nr:ribosome maturation factor RimM [Spirochaetaceae bacterium]